VGFGEGLDKFAVVGVSVTIFTPGGVEEGELVDWCSCFGDMDAQAAITVIPMIGTTDITAWILDLFKKPMVNHLM
jgi:hypothetical protein